MELEITTQSDGHIGFTNDFRYNSHTGDFVTVGDDSLVKIWNNDGTFQESLSGHENSVTGVDLSPDGNFIASVDSEGYIKLWDYKNRTSRDLNSHKYLHDSTSIKSVRFTPDGKKVVLADGNRITFLNMNGEVVDHLKINKEISFNHFGIDLVNGNTSLNHYISPKELFLNKDYIINSWDLNDRFIDNFHKHSDVINSLNFSSDGNKFVSGGADKKVIIWDLINKAAPKIINHQEKVNSVAFSRNGLWVATASDDKLIRVWNLSGELIKEISGHTSEVNSVLFSPDGKYLASAGNDRKINLWSTEKWEKNLEINIPQGVDSSALDALGFSTDGKMISYGNNRVYVRFLNKGLHRFIGLNELVFDSLKAIPDERLPPDDKWLTFERNDGVIILSLGLDYAMENACEWAKNYLENRALSFSKAGKESVAQRERAICNEILD